MRVRAPPRPMSYGESQGKRILSDRVHRSRARFFTKIRGTLRMVASELGNLSLDERRQGFTCHLSSSASSVSSVSKVQLKNSSRARLQFACGESA